LLKRGRYGVVYEGHFNEAFSMQKLTTRQLHYLFVRPEQNGANGDMRAGRKFAVKFCDIESGKGYAGYLIEDIEQRLQQEVNFVRRVHVYRTMSLPQSFVCTACWPPSPVDTTC